MSPTEESLCEFRELCVFSCCLMSSEIGNIWPGKTMFLADIDMKQLDIVPTYLFIRLSRDFAGLELKLNRNPPLNSFIFVVTLCSHLPQMPLLVLRIWTVKIWSAYPYLYLYLSIPIDAYRQLSLLLYLYLYLSVYEDETGNGNRTWNGAKIESLIILMMTPRLKHDGKAFRTHTLGCYNIQVYLSTSPSMMVSGSM